MNKIVFMFPGQGSQFKGMGLDFYENFEKAKSIYKEADKILGYSISDICFTGSEEDLKKTIYSQPAILTTSIAILEVFKEQYKIRPDYVLGHSLGEYVALYEAGVLSFEDTLRAISKRAEYMDVAANRTKGGMLAVLNAELDLLEKIVKEISKNKVLSIANYNSPTQIVLTGETEGIAEAQRVLLENGVKKIIPLAVSGAFHGALMKEAAEKFSQFLDTLSINSARIPVITNVDSKETVEVKEFREKMPKQIYSPVYWTQSIQYLCKKGVNIFYEIGAGKVLTGLNKKINSEITTYNISSFESLNLQK